MAEGMDTDLRQAAKAAAAAAAVGAAIGAARAIAGRAEASIHRDDEDRDRENEPDTLRDDARLDPDHTEPRQEEAAVVPEPGPDPGRGPVSDAEPAHGASSDRLRRVADTARDLLEELSGAEVEAVSALDRRGAGWRVTLEAVEVRRVPDSTDVLASYEVDLDGDCELIRYERRGRYSRSQSDRWSDR